MHANEYLSEKRFWHLLKHDVVVNLRQSLIGIGAVFGLLLIINVASVTSWDQWNMHEVFYPLTLLIGGHVFTSLAFRDLFHKQKSYVFLTLPASQIEKYLFKLISTTIGFAAVATIVYFLFSLLASGITTLFFRIAHPVFKPFSPFVWDVIPFYLVTQSVTFFGAVYFKKLHLLKTILSLTVFGILAGVVVTLLARVIFWEFFTGFFTPNTEALFLDLDISYFGQYPSFERFTKTLILVAQILFYAVMPLFFWITGFIRFRETEVQNGF